LRILRLLLVLCLFLSAASVAAEETPAPVSDTVRSFDTDSRESSTGRLNAALGLLPENSQAAARTVTIEVAPVSSPSGALGGFYPQEHRIVLSPALLAEDVDIAVLATMLIHELVHVQQYAERSVSQTGTERSASQTGADRGPDERSCYPDEIEAFRAMATFWMDVYGPNGKQPAASRTEIGLNNLVMAHRRDVLEEWVTPAYVEICRNGLEVEPHSATHGLEALGDEFGEDLIASS